MSRIAEKFHKALCVTQHPAGGYGFPCGIACEVLNKELVRIGWTGRRGPTGMYAHQLLMEPASSSDLPAYVFDNDIVRGERSVGPEGT